MKKIIFAIIACFALCSCHTQFGIAYGVKLTGNGDGQFEVSFPEGSYAMDGTASSSLPVMRQILYLVPCMMRVRRIL